MTLPACFLPSCLSLPFFCALALPACFSSPAPLLSPPLAPSLPSSLLVPLPQLCPRAPCFIGVVNFAGACKKCLLSPDSPRFHRARQEPRLSRGARALRFVTRCVTIRNALCNIVLRLWLCVASCYALRYGLLRSCVTIRNTMRYNALRAVPCVALCYALRCVLLRVRVTIRNALRCILLRPRRLCYTA